MINPNTKVVPIDHGWANMKTEQAVFSHETSLFLHDLTDREPMEYEITVKTGYNPSKLRGMELRYIQ